MTIIDTITLPEPLLWLNRDNQVRVSAAMTWALNGAPHVEQTLIESGVSMTLGTSDAWLTRDMFTTLQAHSVSTFEVFTLEQDGQPYQVIWDHTQGAAVVGVDLIEQVGGHEDLTQVVLRFLTA